MAKKKTNKSKSTTKKKSAKKDTKDLAKKEYTDEEKARIAQEKREEEKRDAPEKDEIIKKIPFDRKQKLIQLRERKGLTRKQVAQLVQQSHTIIDNYENAKGTYDPDLYNRIIQQLHKHPDPKGGHSLSP